MQAVRSPGLSIHGDNQARPWKWWCSRADVINTTEKIWGISLHAGRGTGVGWRSTNMNPRTLNKQLCSILRNTFAQHEHCFGAQAAQMLMLESGRPWKFNVPAQHLMITMAELQVTPRHAGWDRWDSSTKQTQTETVCSVFNFSGYHTWVFNVDYQVRSRESDALGTASPHDNNKNPGRYKRRVERRGTQKSSPTQTQTRSARNLHKIHTHLHIYTSRHAVALPVLCKYTIWLIKTGTWFFNHCSRCDTHFIMRAYFPIMCACFSSMHACFPSMHACFPIMHAYFPIIYAHLWDIRLEFS